MARLGSVLGSILAELARARVVADVFTSELTAKYEADSLLASMSVPRITLSDATLTLRFSVLDVEEIVPRAPDPSNLLGDWSRHVATALTRLLVRRGLDAEEQASASATIAQSKKAPPQQTLEHLRKALTGDVEPLLTATVDPIVESWRQFSANITAKLATQASFRREVEQCLADEFKTFVDLRRELDLVQAALASRIEVDVRAEQLRREPQLVQEIRMTIRGDDLEVFVAPTGEAG